MKKKAILLQPPIEDYYYTFVRTYPLNLCYLATILENYGLDVEVYDLIDGSKKIIPTPLEFKYLNKFYLPWDKSPYSLFKHYQRFGMLGLDCENLVKSLNGDYFLIPSNFTTYFQQTLEIATYVRKYHPSAKIITGGYHASSAPNKVMGTGLFDHVIVGEGEEGLIEILSNSNEKIIYGKKFSNFESFIPDRKFLNNNKYIINGKKAASLTLSRGCPMKCEFCTIHSVYNFTYRSRSIDSILNEISVLYNEFQIRHFDFEDDNLHGDFLIEILNRISGLKFENCSFSAMNGIPYLTLNESIIKIMKKIGFTHLDISFATNMNVMKRKTDKSKFMEIVKFAKKYQLPVNGYFILGLPEMDFENNLDIIKFLAKLDVNIGPSVYYTVPGIPYYDEKINNMFCRGSAIYTFKQSKLTIEEIVILFRLCRAINFLKKKDKTDFDKLVEKKTIKNGLQFVKKAKSDYNFIPIEGGFDLIKKVM